MKGWFGKIAAGRNASRWFARLHSPDVGESTDRDFSRWLSRDPRNEAEFERRELLWELLGELEDAPAVLQSIRRPSVPAGRWRPQPRVWVKWGLTAAALSALAVGAYWRLETPSRDDSVAPIQEMLLTTRTGEEKQIVLADGSRVLLNTATRLRERLTPQLRWIDLEQGEAVFLVRHDAQWPFVVVAGRTSTRDLGTAFDVFHLAGRTDVSVLKGRVQVDASSATSARQQVILSAGQAAAYTKAGGLGSVRAADLSRIAAWQRHRVEFHDDTLATAVADFNRYITTPIVIGDASLAGLRVSGVFRCGDSSAFIRALHGTFGIRSVSRRNSVVLLPGRKARGTR